MPSSFSFSSSFPTKVSETMLIDQADVIRLIQAYLLEEGLMESLRTLQKETGIGLPGFVGTAMKTSVQSCVQQGQWGPALESLQLLDQRQHDDTKNTFMAQLHECVLHDTAQARNLEAAYALLKVMSSLSEDYVQETIQSSSTSSSMTRQRLWEQQLAHVAATGQLPSDWESDDLQMEKRKALADQLGQRIPVVPSRRLIQYMQQAIKWQAYTGIFPTISQELYEEDAEEEPQKEQEGEKTKKRKKRKIFDLVLGQVEASTTTSVGAQPLLTSSKGSSHAVVPKDIWSTVKFGKSNVCESVLWLPDASALITGSSDGWIEVWDPATKCTKLQTDSPYQGSLGQEGDESPVTALAVTRDAALLASGNALGHVSIWNLKTGTCLRTWKDAHPNAPIVALDWNPTDTRLITTSTQGNCREFGLRTGRLLQEYLAPTQGHLTSAQYMLLPTKSFLDTNDDDEDDASSKMITIVTGSADGMVRIWNARTGVCLRAIQARLVESSEWRTDKASSASLSVSATNSHTPPVDAAAIIAVIAVEAKDEEDQKRLVVVSRNRQALCLDLEGHVRCTYSFPKDDGACFVAACTSPDGQWLYGVSDKGHCEVWDAALGAHVATIQDFALDSTGKASSKDGATRVPEITGLVHHPQKVILSAYSNDKAQKKGILTLWK